MKLSLDCKPRLSQGCNLREEEGREPLILIPEGIIKLKGSSVEILKACDGKRTLGQIVNLLHEKYKISPVQIMDEVQDFLGKLLEKKIVTI